MASGNAVWIKGDESVSGSWHYLGNDRFSIVLDAICPYQGTKVAFTIIGDDVAEFNGWKIQKEAK